MVVIYFSGTGNSRYVAELFCNEYDEGAKAFSIEDDDITQASIAKVNSGRSIPKAEVTLANSQTEVTLANFYISVLFHAIV